MTYPQAPWILQGFALQTSYLLDIKQVRSCVPSELDIISVWPGKTVGGVYVASYGLGSTLEYNELIVVSGLVRHADKFGAWVSHIYVDSPDSVAGGREIWGLPKELAQFSWQLGQRPSVRVYQGDQLLCSLSYDWQLPEWRQPLSLSSFSALGSDWLFLEGRSELSLCLVGGNLEVPAQSPFSSLGFSQMLFSVYSSQMRVVIDAPKVVGERAIA